MKKSDLFFDLDGTLLDTRQRHYAVYADVLLELQKQALSLEEYWSMKREAIPNVEILARTNAADSFDQFNRLWNTRIEERCYLQKDQIVEGALPVLTTLAEQRSLLLVTLRQSEESLHWELQSLGLNQFFESVLVACKPNADWSDKANLLAAKRIDPSSWLIGDTEADVLAARAAGLRCCAISWGIRSKEFLVEQRPDILVDHIADIVHLA